MTSGTHSGYTLQNNETEYARLHRQVISLREPAAALLEPVKLPPDASAVDLGCGPGGALPLLSQRVGPGGHVLGVDLDARSVASARAYAREHRLPNVTIIEADARSTGLAGSSFDLVHTRLLLVNIPSPEQVVSEMARLVRPGGWVAILEPDIGLRACHPSHPSLSRLAELLATAYRRRGADPHLGRRLPHLLATAGLVEIGVQARAEVSPPGDPQRTVIADLVQNMRAKLVDQRMVEERELDRLDRAAREHLNDPKTLSIPVTYFLAWARKPPRPG